MGDTPDTTADALKQPTIIIDRAQSEIDRLRALIEEAYQEGVRDGETGQYCWWNSWVRRQRDGLV